MLQEYVKFIITAILITRKVSFILDARIFRKAIRNCGTVNFEHYE